MAYDNIAKKLKVLMGTLVYKQPNSVQRCQFQPAYQKSEAAIPRDFDVSNARKLFKEDHDNIL